MATYDNLDLVRTSIEYRDITNTTNPNYNFGTRTFSFADIELLEGIPAQDQLEIERIFPVNTLGSSKYEGVQLTIADRRLMFKLPKQWFTVDVINKTITIKDIANTASNDYIPAPAASTGPYYDINLGTSRTFKLLAATTPPSANQTIIIPGLAVNDDIIIRRRTVSTEKVVNFAPGSRLTSGQLNLQVSQLVNLVQELMWKVDQEFILKFDESAVDGPFLGNKDLDMGSFSIINMGMPGVDGDAFPPNAEAEPEDIDRVGRMAVNKYFLQNVYTDYVSDTVVANWDAGGRSGALVTRLAGFDTSLAAKQPLNTNLTTLQGTTNASGLVSLGNSSNLALVTAIGALASGNTGFIKKSGASTVTLDTNTYLTGNQSISLSGAVAGSGTTSISTTLATNAVGTSNINNLAVTNDKIADSTITNAKLANSTISSVALGSNLFTLTRGSYLTGNNYNGSAAQTFAVDADTANTANKVVARDASGNFAANTITAALSGNATTATALQNARTIGLSDGAIGTATSFNGSANITIPVTALDANKITSGTLSVDRLGATSITDAKLAQITTAGKIALSALPTNIPDTNLTQITTSGKIALTALPTGITDTNLSTTGIVADTYANSGLNIPQLGVSAAGRITSISNRDLANSVVSTIQANAPYISSGVFTAGEKRITNLAAPTVALDAVNKNYVDTNFLKLAVGNVWDSLDRRITNISLPINAKDAATKEFVEGLQLFGTAQTDPQLFEFNSLSGTADGSHTRYELSIDTLTTTNQSMLIVYDNINNIYGPGTNTAASYKFFLNIVGANKTLKVWVPTASSQPTSIKVRNFGVSRITQTNLATATAVGLSGFPVDGGLTVSNGFVSANKSDSISLSSSNSLATSTAVKTAYDSATSAQNAANAAQTTANTAVTNAAAAQVTADTAVANAAAAQGTANAALPLTGGTVTGALNVNGAVVLGDANTDTLTITGTAITTPNGLNFDSNTLVVDATNNRVGIGTASPLSSLHIKTASPGGATGLRIENGGTYLAIEQQNSSYTHFYTSAPKYYFDKTVELGDGILSSYSTTDLQLKTNATTRIRAFNSTGNILIGTGTADPSVKLYVDGEIKAKTSLILNGSTSGTSTIVAQATAGTTTFTLPTTTGTLIGSNDTSTVSNTMLAGSIADSKLSTIATPNKVSIAALDIDGGTDIGAGLEDADLIIVDDGGAGANRKAAVTRIAPYVFSKVSGDISIAANGTATIATNSVALGTDTTGNYVATIAGTTNQVTVTGSGSESAGVTLSLPQDIHTTANPTFAGATLGTTQVGVTADNEIDTSAGNLILDSTGGTVQVDDNLLVTGNITLKSNSTNKLEVLNNAGDEGFVLERVITDGTGTANSGDLVIRLTQPSSETENRRAYLLSGNEIPGATNQIATKQDIDSIDLSNYVTSSSFNNSLSNYMLTTGSLATGNQQVIGTSDTNSFKIKTNNSDRVTIESNGNVTLANNLTVTGTTTLTGGVVAPLTGDYTSVFDDASLTTYLTKGQILCGELGDVYYKYNLGRISIGTTTINDVAPRLINTEGIPHWFNFWTGTDGGTRTLNLVIPANAIIYVVGYSGSATFGSSLTSRGSLSAKTFAQPTAETGTATPASSPSLVGTIPTPFPVSTSDQTFTLATAGASKSGIIGLLRVK
jgi:hypothetical protein